MCGHDSIALAPQHRQYSLYSHPCAGSTALLFVNTFRRTVFVSSSSTCFFLVPPLPARCASNRAMPPLRADAAQPCSPSMPLPQVDAARLILDSQLHPKLGFAVVCTAASSPRLHRPAPPDLVRPRSDPARPAARS